MIGVAAVATPFASHCSFIMSLFRVNCDMIVKPAIKRLVRSIHMYPMSHDELKAPRLLHTTYIPVGRNSSTRYVHILQLNWILMRGRGR